MNFKPSNQYFAFVLIACQVLFTCLKPPAVTVDNNEALTDDGLSVYTAGLMSECTVTNCFNMPDEFLKVYQRCTRSDMEMLLMASNDCVGVQYALCGYVKMLSFVSYILMVLS